MNLKSNKIWKLIIVALLITATAIGQQGSRKASGKQGIQQGPPPIPTAKQINTMVKDLSKEILLTEEQETKVLTLYTAHFTEVKNKMKSGRPDRSEMEKLKDVFEGNVKAVLTKDQQKLFSAYQKKNNKKGK